MVWPCSKKSESYLEYFLRPLPCNTDKGVEFEQGDMVLRLLYPSINEPSPPSVPATEQDMKIKVEHDTIPQVIKYEEKAIHKISVIVFIGAM